MERKFKLYDEVLICAAYTGKGDVKAFVTNYFFNKVKRCYFYDLKDYAGNMYHLEEHFLEKYRETSESIIASSKKEFRSNHTEAEVKAYEPSFIIGNLSSCYDRLLEKHEKLLSKYEAIENEKSVLNPIS